ncbi:MAG TPA: response regulator, partial [Nannocystis exedens]|nr:response regulator [Nannocystis exedens]
IRAAVASEPAPTHLVSFGGSSVLVVNHNPTNRQVLTSMLERWGITVQAAENTELALAAITRGAFDIVLLDLPIPGTEDITLTQKIAENTSIPAPKVIMLIASGDREQIKAAQQAGITTYLTKPFRHADLHAALAKTLRQDRPAIPSKGPAKSPLKRVRMSAPADTDRRSGRVLVVDDNPINLRLAQHTITKLGYTVTCVASGAQAIERVKQEAFDFVFMDCEMPGMDGFETTRKIHAIEGLADLPIVALTAHATDTVRSRCKESGMHDFVAKPPRTGALATVLRHWIPDRARNP